VHAKWAFALLAVVFGLGFVFLGIGSGSSGITDALQNAFHFGHASSGASISSLESKTQKHPYDAQAWRDLATAYEAKQRTNDAIVALAQYTGLKPKDGDALSELAQQYTTQAQNYATQYTNLQAQIQAQTPASAIFAPSSSTPLGKAFSDPGALQDPIANAVQTDLQTQESDAYSGYTSALTQAEKSYQKLVKLTPNDPNAQIQLGQAAENAQDTAVAIAAFTKFLKLAPHDPLAGQVKQQLKSLKASAAGSSTSSKSK